MSFIPFAGTVGSWMGAGAASSAAAATVGGIAIASTAASLGTLGYSLSQRAGGMNLPGMPDIKAMEKEENVRQDQAKKIRAGYASRKTLLTGPQGLLEAAPIAKKNLLGE